MILQSKCTGKAQDTINAFDQEQCRSYATMKKGILQAYELVPDSYRTQFRTLTKQSEETYVEFAQKKKKLLTRWLDSRQVNSNFDNLYNLILVEEFKKQLPSEIRTHLNDLNVLEIKQCTTKADEYAITQKSFTHHRTHSSHSQYKTH